MQLVKTKAIQLESIAIPSSYLNRFVKVDCYLPKNLSEPENLPLLFINDGQDLPVFDFENMLNDLITSNTIEPIIVIAIHCGEDRKNEYGTACISDYKGRGAKAEAYTYFIFEELLPAIRKKYILPNVREKAFAGFSLGALSALDIVWNHANQFDKVGCFSGSFWWRTRDINDAYSEDLDRIMHQQVRAGSYAPWLQFFFECGTLDEAEDRNGNGVIDSIDDTRELIDELVKKGYTYPGAIAYYEIEGGLHDVPTWGKAMPEFLKWGWGIYKDEAN
jgi:enterochelin esterase-like enzyme